MIEQIFVTPRETAHYRVLRLIEDQPEISQRELSRALGVSLGKTHYLLKALLDKGLVKADNFRRSDNKRAYAYLLTPSGIAAKLDLTRRFLQIKEAEYRVVREEIEQLRLELDAVAGSASARQKQRAEKVPLEAPPAHARAAGRPQSRQAGR